MGATAIAIGVALVGLAALALFGALAQRRLRVRGRDQAHRRRELDAREERLEIRESTLETKAHTLELREGHLIDRERRLDAQQADLDDARIVVRKRLEEIADYTVDEARRTLMREVEADARADARDLVREVEERARAESTRRSHDIVATAIQRVAASATHATVTSTIELPDAELKGRIIGREGRNIRAFEHLTGVDLLVDESPGVVVLSSFDPVRRETARRTLVALLEDGRIHPSSIEAAHERARAEVDEAIVEAGDEAAVEAGVDDLAPELRRLLGQLEFRTSYGQNVRAHAVETALLAGAMAEELGVDAALARRCGLLHDIGKALTHRVAGSHAAIGAEVARRLGESEPVVHAIAAHHDEVPPETVEAVLTQAADAVSASRPGARRNNVEAHCQRLQRIEELVGAFDGVSQVHAMQAGREVRVMVSPEAVDDVEARRLAREIARRLESELAYPGQIAVTVIREVRARGLAS